MKNNWDFDLNNFYSINTKFNLEHYVENVNSYLKKLSSLQTKTIDGEVDYIKEYLFYNDGTIDSCYQYNSYSDYENSPLNLMGQKILNQCKGN